jgi:hypothetical protein
MADPKTIADEIEQLRKWRDTSITTKFSMVSWYAVNYLLERVQPYAPKTSAEQRRKLLSCMYNFDPLLADTVAKPVLEDLERAEHALQGGDKKTQ